MLYQILFGAGRVTAYTVHESPTPPTDRMDRAEALRFIKDGFSFPAALAGPVWLATHKLFQALGLYLAGVAMLGVCYMWLGLPAHVAGIMLVAMHVLIGFEADTIERADLERQGWADLGAVTGASALECQRRFFDQWLPAQPVLAPKTAAGAPIPPQSPQPARVTSGRGAAAGRLAALWRGQK